MGMPRGARHVVSLQMGGCGSMSSDAYFISQSSDQRAWWLWFLYDDDIDDRTISELVGEHPRRGSSREEAARVMLRDRCIGLRKEWDWSRPVLCGSGVLEAADVRAIFDEVWG